jgi:Tol biopolymer transport system component
LKDGVARDLSQGPVVEDTSPAFSPDGSLIAFARKFLDAARWTPGRQIWIMGANGEDPHPVSDTPFYNYSAFAWRPDGKQLAYIRFNQDSPTQPPEIWLVKADGSDPQQLVTGGFEPQWIP